VVLEGSRALVTGSGVGIGQEIAVELARQNASVVIHTSATDPAETIGRIDALGATCAGAVTADLATATGPAEAVSAAVEILGGLDILVNNAGKTLERPLAKLAVADVDEILHLNLRAYLLCLQAALPHLVEPAGGAVVNISSIHGGAGLPNFSAYAASKGGVDALTRALAVELAPQGIRVNAVAPGVIEVPRYWSRPGYSHDLYASAIPTGRIGEPSDVAPMVALLCSEAAGWITGQVIYVDGGTSARSSFIREPLE
jgi:NAD(P)-dependent dehydrogenase (short-subunit alcohol dehydrogenase family)